MHFSSCWPTRNSHTNCESFQADISRTRPGDYLQADDDEIEGFKLRLNERLAPVGSQFSGEGVNDEWQIGDTLAQWWRPNFETFMYPFLPAHVTRPKECKKLYFIQLPKSSMSNSQLESASKCPADKVAWLTAFYRGPERTQEHETFGCPFVRALR